MNPPPLGIGMVGAGMVASAHARALAELAGMVEVRGVFARDRIRREAFAGAHGLVAAPSFEALLADPQVSAIVVLTPPNARSDIVAAAAGAGKHVLLEKPVERTTAAARAIVETAERAGITLGVVFQNRFRPGSRALRKLALSGELGRLAAVQIAVPWWRPQSYYDEPGRGTLARDGGGVLINQAIHMLDLALCVAGPVVEVQAIAGTTALHRMEGEDFVGAGLRFASGALGALVASTASFPGAPGHIALDFERGAARLEAGVLTVWEQGGGERRIGESSGTGGGADPMAFSHEWHRLLIADFVTAVRDGRPPQIGGREALEVHRLIDALMDSARMGRAVRLEEIG